MKNYLTVIFIAILVQAASAQFKSKDIESSDAVFPSSYFVIGHMSTQETVPVRMGNPQLEHSGLALGWKYNVKEIEEFDIYRDIKSRLSIGGTTMFGFTAGSGYMNLPEYGTLFPNEVLKNMPVRTYTGLVDFFSMNINSQTYYQFPGKRAVEFNLGITLLNIGGSFTYFDAPGSIMAGSFTYTLNFLPIYIEPSVKFKLKNVTLGLGLFINPVNILEFRWGPAGYYSFEEEGVISSSSSPKKFALFAYLNM